MLDANRASSMARARPKNSNNQGMIDEFQASHIDRGCPGRPIGRKIPGRWSFGDYNSFAQFGASHTGHSFTQAGSNPTFAGSSSIGTSRLRFENAAYSTFSASVGIAKDAWNVMVYGENLANSHAATFTSTDQFIVEQTPLRPRVLGVSFGYKIL
jgi:hypothetical protein